MPCFLHLAGAIALPQVGAYTISSLFSARSSSAWSDGLKKSSLSPPKWIFPIVWPSLYTGMGYASYLVWRDGDGLRGKAMVPLILYGGQLVLNWSWPPLFFGMHNIKGALVDLSTLLIVAAGCGHEFYKINETAGWLMAPYVAWLSFATFLNLRVLQLNSGADQTKNK